MSSAGWEENFLNKYLDARSRPSSPTPQDHASDQSYTNDTAAVQKMNYYNGSIDHEPIRRSQNTDQKVLCQRVNRGRSETRSASSSRKTSSECSDRHVHWDPRIPDHDGYATEQHHAHLSSPPPPAGNRWPELEDRSMGNGIHRSPSLKRFLGGKFRDLVNRN